MKGPGSDATNLRERKQRSPTLPLGDVARELYKYVGLKIKSTDSVFTWRGASQHFTSVFTSHFILLALPI